MNTRDKEKSLRFAVDGIRAKIKMLESELRDAHKAERYFMLKIEQVNVQQSPRRDKRLRKNFTRDAILRLLDFFGELDWQQIQKHISEKKDVEVSRSTIAGTLSRLRKEGVVRRAGGQKWKLAPREEDSLSEQDMEDEELL